MTISDIRAENERQYRIVDQMMTAHAVLRDRFGRRARILNICLLVAAIALNGLVFASDEALELLFFGHVNEAKLWLGATSIVLLALAIVEFRVDWESQSRSHKEAFERLSRLKATFREAEAVGGSATVQGDLTKQYAQTMELLPSIPEQSFIRLKAYHKYKRLLSQKIDQNPGVPAWLLSLRLRASAIRLFYKS